MPNFQRPTRLYKYQPLTIQTLANLKQRSVWFSAPAHFNDPFDCALSGIDPDKVTDAECQDVLDEMLRSPGMSATLQMEMRTADGKVTPKFRESLIKSLQRAFEDERKVRREQRGVACFSELRDDVMMWSHYADGHRGFCLEFSTASEPFSKAFPVSYQDTFPHIPANVLFRRERNPEEEDETVRKILQAFVLTKAPCWSYEHEWRAMHLQHSMLYTYDWRALTGLYFGAAMEYAHKEIISLVVRDSPTQLYSMKTETRGFKLGTERVTYTPFVYKSEGVA